MSPISSRLEVKTELVVGRPIRIHPGTREIPSQRNRSLTTEGRVHDPSGSPPAQDSLQDFCTHLYTHTFPRARVPRDPGEKGPGNTHTVLETRYRLGCRPVPSSPSPPPCVGGTGGPRAGWRDPDSRRASGRSSRGVEVPSDVAPLASCAQGDLVLLPCDSSVGSRPATPDEIESPDRN